MYPGWCGVVPSGRRSRQGFTLVDAVIALVVLVVGVLAMAGTLAMASRMIGRGRQATIIAQAASTRLEWLRQLARSTSPPCTHVRFADDSAIVGSISERWTVPGSGAARRLVLALEYRVPRGMARDTIRTAILCR